MNLAEYFYKFYEILGEADEARFSISLLKRWVDQAESAINNEARCIFKNTVTDATTSRLYSLPSDCLDLSALDRVYYARTGDVDDREELYPTDIQKLNEKYPNWQSDDSSTPSWWYPDFAENKYGLYPYDSSLSSGTDYIKLEYRGKHTRLYRYYSTGTITISGTTVTGSGTSWDSELSAGDKIGAGYLFGIDGDFPDNFYEIESVDSDTELTITTSATVASGSSYIAAQDSDIINERLSDCVIDYMILIAQFKDGKIQYEDFMGAREGVFQRARQYKYGIEKTASSRRERAPYNQIMNGPRRSASRDYGRA